MNESGADQITYALGVVHDPGDEFAGLRRIEIAYGQTRDLRLYLLAHLRDGALRRDPQHLRQTEGRDGLHDGRRARRQRDLPEHIGAPLDNHLVNQVLGRGGQHKPHRLVDEHQHRA